MVKKGQRQLLIGGLAAGVIWLSQANQQSIVDNLLPQASPLEGRLVLWAVVAIVAVVLISFISRRS